MGISTIQLLVNMVIPKYSGLSNSREYRAIHGSYILIGFLGGKIIVGWVPVYLFPIHQCVVDGIVIIFWDR